MDGMSTTGGRPLFEDVHGSSERCLALQCLLGFTVFTRMPGDRK